MSEALAFVAEVREELGTGATRALRRTGRVPAIVYGAGKKPISISVEEKEITKLYRKPGFISTLINLNISGQSFKVLPKAVELHPITDVVRHVDFVFLEKEFQNMEVPVVFDGKERSIGIKRGGFFNTVKRTVLLRCSVQNLPKKVSIDVSSMYIGQSIKANDVKLPDGCQFVNKSNFVIASIIGKAGKAETEEAATK